MPLFESQRKKNDRLFRAAFVAAQGWIASYDWEAWWKDLHCAWFIGGCGAAQTAIEGCHPLRSAWGKGDQTRAIWLAQTFAMPMVVRHLRWDPTMFALGFDHRLRLIEGGVRNMLGVFEDYPLPPSQTAAEYVEIAKQFEFEMDALERGEAAHQWIEMEYLASKACLVLGQESSFSLGEAALPVPSLYEFSKGGGVLGLDPNDLESHQAMTTAVHVGAAVTGKYLKQVTGEVNPHA